MKVYIVTRGEKNEGLDVIGVFSNETKATKFALSQKVSLSRSWQNIDMNLWESGCDLLEVSCWEVK